MKRAIKILLPIAGAVLLLFLALLIFFLWATAGVKLDEGKLSLRESPTLLFDAFDRPIETVQTGATPLAELPPYLPNAFVAVEDKRFYSHRGIDFRRMVKAALKNAASFSFKEGASTISQQLVKNTHLTGEKTILRKLREIRLARALERSYSKQRIIELYLNSIYFGHSAFGITEAARYYFGKQPAALTPAESATLAALVRSPNRYSPFKNAEKCKSRRDFVLSLMEEQGYISREEARAGKREPLPTEPHEAEQSPYLSLVFDELCDLLPDERSGLKVYTYLEPELQKSLEETREESDAAILVRSAAGGVRAFYSTCGRPRRLPASTIKPLAVYAPAIEENLLSPATPLLDERVDYGGYSPSNYGGTYGGYMSARYALSRSVNTPAVKILNSLGVDRAADYLGKMGLPVPEGDRTLALALGGMREGYTLARLADGYATLQSGGIYSPSRTVRRVENARGETVYPLRRETGERVFSEDSAYLVSDMLRTAAREGTAKKLRTLPFEVCAKTGTGGTDRGNTDAYTIAYTTKDVVAVWLGNRDNAPIEATGGGIPANLAKQTLERLYADAPPPPFPECSGVKEVVLDREEYEKKHRLLLADPLAPSALTMKELFRSCAVPEGTSSAFSKPKIEKPLISVKNGAVRIELCQTYYYDYVVKRECQGEISVIYRGKYRKELFDNSVRAGRRYTYTVVPFYLGVEGEAVVLPSVTIEDISGVPDDWWQSG